MNNRLINKPLKVFSCILRAAEKTNVKRVIMTANFGAVGFSNKDKSSVTTEEHWTNPNEKGFSVYEKSKLIL